jgi:hypothetical protein
MDPEELARQNIDGRLLQAGWLVQNRARMNLFAGRIVAEVERQLSFTQEVEGMVAASLKRVTRLRQAVLRAAFEGRLL